MQNHKIKITPEITIAVSDLFGLVGKANGLRGRQKVIACDTEFDGWVFYSNARGVYGERLSFYYLTTDQLLRDIGF